MNHTTSSTRTGTEISKKTQQGSSEGEGGIEGGYVASYHELEELSYGPMSCLDRIAKVFMCIKHKTTRDAVHRKYISREFIIEKTGLNRGEVGKALKKLETKEMIRVHRNFHLNKKGAKVWGNSEYELHPKMFGAHLNWYQNNQKLTVINGGKSYPQSRPGVSSNESIGVSSDSSIGVSSDSSTGKSLKFAELIEKIQSKNPCIKNPEKRTQKSDGDFFSNESEAEIIARNKAKFERQRREMGV